LGAEDQTHYEDKARDLLRRIRQDARQLESVLWSPEDWNQIGKTMEIWQARMKNQRDDIIEHLMWYKRIGWKKFVPDAGELENQTRLQAIADEKERLKEWLEGQLHVSEFYLIFKRQLKESRLSERLAKSGLQGWDRLHVLDAACGDGHWLRTFAKWGADVQRLAGLEPCGWMLERASRLSPPGIAFKNAFADERPFQGKRFDLILAFGLFMHILDDGLRSRVAQELAGALGDGGLIVTFDFLPGTEKGLEPYLRYTTKGLGREELARLFPDCEIECETLPLSDQYPDYGYGLAAIRKRKPDRKDGDSHGA